jgi:hypothetical protein
MPMNTTYLNATATHGAGLITHIGLVNELDTELSGGDYARQPVTWTAADDGLVRPTANLEFAIQAGTTVTGWRGYSALTAGTDYGGKALPPVAFTLPGTYRLLAASTGIDHDAA